MTRKLELNPQREKRKYIITLVGSFGFWFLPEKESEKEREKKVVVVGNKD